MEPEQVFLKYAVPCAHILVEWKKLSPEKLEWLKQSAINGKSIPKHELEGIFVAAFRRMRKVGGDNYWTPEAIRTYFQNYHNDFIMDGDGNYEKFGPTLKEMCKVKKAKINKILREGVAEVEYSGKKLPVFLELVPDAKVGDEVFIHHSFAVEKA